MDRVFQTSRNLWDWLDRPEDTPPLDPPEPTALAVAGSWTANANVNGNLAVEISKMGFYLTDITEPKCSG
jgi:hypothetical protein